MGCLDDDVDDSQQLDSLDRYITANGAVVNVTNSGDACLDPASISCYRLTFSVNVWLKEEDISIFGLIALVDGIYGPDSEDLKKKTHVVYLVERFD